MKENIVAATACCGAACVANDMNENFKAVEDHVNETVTIMEDNVKDDIVAVEENAIHNIEGFEEGMNEDITSIVDAAGASTKAAAAAIGAGVTAVAAAASVAATAPDADDADDEDADNEDPNSEDPIEGYVSEDCINEDDATLSREEEESSRSDDQINAEDKAAYQESAMEKIDTALKTADWVGVLSTANEIAQVEETDADTTDAESVVAPYQKPDCLSRCCLDSDDLGAISDSIVVVGSNLTHEDEVAEVEIFGYEHHGTSS
jgi:hypothetical protein